MTKEVTLSQSVSLSVLLERADIAPHEVDDTVRELLQSLRTLSEQIATDVAPDQFEEEESCRALVMRIKQLGRDPSIGSVSSQYGQESDQQQDLGRIRDYQLLAKIGEGGMGSVYKALHTQLEKVVALKVLPTNRLKDQKAVDRFKREMRAVGKMDHQHIVSALDGGEENGRQFLVMEYVQGTDLAQLVASRGPLNVADACELVRQAALGLEEAHDCGMVHRDIKPSNLILALRKQQPPLVKILDLGLAQLNEYNELDGEGLTASGQMMGTLDYMAPEQAGDVRGVDIRADIYSLGATLYKLLTGEAIFSGENYQTPLQKVTAMATRAAPPIQQRQTGIPDRLAAVIHRMLEKEAAARFQTPKEVVQALQPYCQGADLSALTQGQSWDATSASEIELASKGSRKSFALEETGVFDKDLSESSRQKPIVDTAVTVDLPPAASAQRTKSGIPWQAKIAALLGGLAGIVYLGVVLLIPSKYGAIRVEIMDPSIEVTVDGNERLHVAGKTGKFSVEAGPHQLSITTGGTTFQTADFTVDKGNELALRVQLIDGSKIQVVTADNKVLDEHQLSIKAPPANGFAAETWQPTDEQQAFLNGVSQLPVEARKAAVAKKIQEVSFNEVAVSFETFPELKLASPACNQIWPLVGIEGIETIAFVGSSVLDFRPLQKMKVRKIQLQIPVYNSEVDAVLRQVSTLQTINGKPAAKYFAEREAIRKKIDDFANNAPQLSQDLVIAWVNTMLDELNPPAGSVSLKAVSATDHNLIGYTHETDGFFVNARICGGLHDLSPLRVLPFSSISLSGTQVFDLSPLQGLPLKGFEISHSSAHDLSPLRGMPLQQVGIENCLVSDIKPLAGASLTSFVCSRCPLADLSPLSGMPLTRVSISGLPVADLSPIEGMKLTSLDCSSTSITDISVLAGMPLKTLDIRQERSEKETRDLSVLNGMPLESLGIDYNPQQRKLLEGLELQFINGMTADDFWVSIRKEQDRFHYSGLAENLKSKSGLMFTPEAEQKEFFSVIEKFPPQAQLNAIVSKIAELANEGAEASRGALFAVELTPAGDAPTKCIIDAWSVHQIWPLAGIKTLEQIDLVGASITDFSPLSQLPVRELNAEIVLYNRAADSVLQEMATLETVNGQPKEQYLAQRAAMRTAIDDFQQTANSLPVRDIFAWVAPRLHKLNPDYRDPEFIAGGIQPGDSRISLDSGLLKIWSGANLRDLSPLRVLPFDQLHLMSNNNIGGPNIYDLSSLSGLPLKSISIGGAPLADLRPLTGMPLNNLEFNLTAVSDLAPLENMKLESIQLVRTFVADFSPLKKIKSLKLINGKPTEEFWKK